MEDSLILRTELDDVRAMDVACSTEEEDVFLCQKTSSLWDRVDIGDSLGFLGKAALVYGLKTTRLSSGRWKWQDTQLVEGVRLAVTWPEFCLLHLKMSYKTASSYKRLWEVFVEGMGYSFPDLLRAGKSKLVSALATASGLWPGRHDGLERALFGDVTTCANCRGRVLYDEGIPPLVCVHCGNAWESVEPATYVETLLVLRGIRDEQRGEDPDAGRVVVDYEVEEDVIRELPWWVEGDERYPLPVRIINVLHSDEVGEGLPAVQATAYVDYMRRKHR